MTVREVDEPMRFALEQAWEAFVSGSFPVGAALVDAGGAIVAVGRNRMGESSAPDGRLRSTGLAHAEMDVLSQLPMGDYGGHTLVTTLEPCLLCRSAATMAHVGKVQFLAADSICDGLDELLRINQHAGRWYPDMQGPSTGVAADFASILPMAVLLLFGPTGDAAAHYRIHSPREFAVADVMARENRWPARELTVDAAIAHVSGLVASIAGA
jgi:tRNA(adenine34) deaminase